MNRPIAELAAEEFTRRLATARRKVAQNLLEPAEADALLHPWLALACRAGAMLPQYADALEDFRGGILTEGQAHAVVADEICPRPRIISVLATARDAAFARAETDPGHSDRASALMLLANAFRAPPIRPFTAERQAA